MMTPILATYTLPVLDAAFDVEQALQCVDVEHLYPGQRALNVLKPLVASNAARKWPVAGMGIVQAWVNEYLCHKAKYRMRPVDYFAALKPFISTELLESLESRDEREFQRAVTMAADSVMHDLTCSIYQVIEQDLWAIYFVKLQGQILVLEKSIDYRIHDWMSKYAHQYKYA